MKKNYAYLDKGGILHVSKNYETARTYSKNGIIVETGVEAEHGYPLHSGKQIIVYGPEEMKVTADGADIDIVPELAKLYNKCK